MICVSHLCRRNHRLGSLRDQSRSCLRFSSRLDPKIVGRGARLVPDYSVEFGHYWRPRSAFAAWTDAMRSFDHNASPGCTMKNDLEYIRNCR